MLRPGSSLTREARLFGDRRGDRASERWQPEFQPDCGLDRHPRQRRSGNRPGRRTLESNHLGRRKLEP